jgi:hypothetical protein
MEMSPKVGSKKVDPKRMASHPYYREREGMGSPKGDECQNAFKINGRKKISIILFDNPLFLY